MELDIINIFVYQIDTLLHFAYADFDFIFFNYVQDIYTKFNFFNCNYERGHCDCGTCEPQTKWQSKSVIENIHP